MSQDGGSYTNGLSERSGKMSVQVGNVRLQTSPLKVVFCLPGNNFSGRFLDCWSNLLLFCTNNNIQSLISRQQSCNIYYVRNMCLGGNVSRGADQKPFDGQVDYDYLMWIDSDIVFGPLQFQSLLNRKQDIVAGVYAMEGGKQLAVVKDWNEEFFKQHGYFEFMTPEDIKDKKDIIPVSYVGFGFILIKKGVFEKMSYPWFRPIDQKIGKAVDFCMEDVAFCLRAKELGFKVYIDPTVRVLHEKKVLL